MSRIVDFLAVAVLILATSGLMAFVLSNPGFFGESITDYACAASLVMAFFAGTALSGLSTEN